MARPWRGATIGWLAACQAGRSARASEGSADSAAISARATEKLAAIEQSRQHDDLRPQLELACQASVMDEAQLSIRFVGPAALNRLDEVTVRIREEEGKPEPGATHTAESLAEAFWGPYIFKRGIAGVSADRSAFGPFPLQKDQSIDLWLAKPPYPSWNTNPQYWQSKFADAPLRLEITCKADGHDPWEIVRSVDVLAEPTVNFL